MAGTLIAVACDGGRYAEGHYGAPDNIQNRGTERVVINICNAWVLLPSRKKDKCSMAESIGGRITNHSTGAKKWLSGKYRWERCCPCAASRTLMNVKSCVWICREPTNWPGKGEGREPIIYQQLITGLACKASR